MTRPIDIASAERGTGKVWRERLAFLGKIGARHLPHKEIARRVREECSGSSRRAQSIAVAYEQHIGRRVPGTRGLEVSRTDKWAIGAAGLLTARGSAWGFATGKAARPC